MSHKCSGAKVRPEIRKNVCCFNYFFFAVSFWCGVFSPRLWTLAKCGESVGPDLLSRFCFFISRLFTPSASRRFWFSLFPFPLWIYWLLQLVPSQLPSSVPDFEAPHLPGEFQEAFASRPRARCLSTPVTVFLLLLKMARNCDLTDLKMSYFSNFWFLS